MIHYDFIEKFINDLAKKCHTDDPEPGRRWLHDGSVRPGLCFNVRTDKGFFSSACGRQDQKRRLTALWLQSWHLTGASAIRRSRRGVFMMSADYLCYNMKKTSLATGLISFINQLPISDANT